MNILITGGSGFIGSNFIYYLLKNSEVNIPLKIINLDKLTYAARGDNIEHMNIKSDIRYKFIKGDISDKDVVEEIFQKENIDFVFNFAAESHVDRSINGPREFVITNELGTLTLLETSKKFGIKKFIQISTDEVYGSIEKGSFEESSILRPSSSYSASKAAAEHHVLAYFITHNIPVIITRSANNYGPYQHPEKFLPRSITELLEGRNIPLMWSNENPGLNVRDWLHVEDNCRAIWYIANNGKIGEIYNIPGENEKTNIEMARMILNHFHLSEDRITKIEHRKGHDYRYSISGKKLFLSGFQYKHHNLNVEIGHLCEWYKKNESWWKKLCIK